MNRKDEHVSLAKAFHKEKTNDFDSVHLIHESLPQIDATQIDLHTTVGGFQLTSPFYINAMTGGSEKTKQINHDLAYIAKETGLMIATGSVSAALKDPSVKDSYTIMREVYPEGKILTNVGAGVSLKKAQAAVELFHADALQIHLNAPQELVMPEGDRDFTSWLSLIEEIVAKISVPVIVKEVGFGMTRQTIKQLIDCGVQTIDVSGQGGTSFTQIENTRRKKREFSYLNDWGQSTVISLLEANEVPADFDLIASGGIRNAYDIFKALCLGAQAVGISGTILNELLTNGIDETITLIRNWQNQLQTLFALVGAQSIADLRNQSLLITGHPKEWCDARQISIQKYALRTNENFS
ncbi:MAG: type 2 isopentenyl-diphosphate Delta-isomerase [Enterococcus sp.]